MSASFDLRKEEGPFDVIGDVHGCLDEMLDLLQLLGYRDGSVDGLEGYVHPDQRQVVFLGDLGDRGPHSGSVFRLAMAMVEHGRALYTPGNHCNKLMRYLQGHKVQQNEGLAGTISDVEEMELDEGGFKKRLRLFIEDAPPYLWLCNGKMVVAHAGIKSEMIGEETDAVRRMCLYGDITGQKNPDGTPVRLDWAQSYHGRAAIIYGHTPTAGPMWVNDTANIDQGCVFGGWLTAMRWPEREVMQVRARQAYYTERTPAFLTRPVQDV